MCFNEVKTALLKAFEIILEKWIFKSRHSERSQLVLESVMNVFMKSHSLKKEMSLKVESSDHIKETIMEGNYFG